MQLLVVGHVVVKVKAVADDLSDGYWTLDMNLYVNRENVSDEEDVAGVDIPCIVIDCVTPVVNPPVILIWLALVP